MSEPRKWNVSSFYRSYCFLGASFDAVLNYSLRIFQGWLYYFVINVLCCRSTATWLSYHTHFRLSSTFFKFFKLFLFSGLLFFSQQSIFYHILYRLSSFFWNFFWNNRLFIFAFLFHNFSYYIIALIFCQLFFCIFSILAKK